MAAIEPFLGRGQPGELDWLSDSVVHCGGSGETGWLSSRSKGGSLGIIAWIVFGLIAGIIAKLIMPGRDPGGCIITMLLGVAGAFVGGFLYRLLTGREVFFQFDLWSLVVAVLGAVVILVAYRLIAGRRA
jgi:uncharacterized membrane protein YeaQ/YmgE (transglycosylase-associated protein family)